MYRKNAYIVNILLDENVSSGLIVELQSLGYQVFSVMDHLEKSVSDNEVWNFAKKLNALLITRDYHFTNRLRFDPKEVSGILFLRQGNLKSEREIQLVIQFLSRYSKEVYLNKMVTLSIHEVKIRN